MADVFLSYNQTDRPIAQAIAAELQRLGVDVWWDHDLLGGDDFRARIAEVLTRSIVTTVIWSRRSIDSQWVVGEASAARERKTLVPITLDGASPALDFRPLHTINFVNWVPGDQLPPAFLKAVGERLGRNLSYSETPSRTGLVGRFSRKAVQSWYLDFESILFYLIGQGLACVLCMLPLSYIAHRATPSASILAELPWWMPYFFSLVVGMVVAALYMRPILATSRLPIAVPLFIVATLLSAVSYAVCNALIARLGNDIIMFVGAITFMLLMITAVADRAHRS